MSRQTEQLQPIATIAQTGFYVSLVAYLIFWGADLLNPGFVSRYFSVHVFLLSMFIFGVLWAYRIERYIERQWTQQLTVLLSTVALVALCWPLTAQLEVYRLLVVFIAALTPWWLYRCMK